MTTPGGVANLPMGALTLDTLAATLQDMTPAAMRARAAERMPSIFDSSLGGPPASDWSLFGILTQLFAGFNSAVANADPADITGPDDLPGLLVNFIEELPLISELVDLIKLIISGGATADDVLEAIANVFNTLGRMLGLSAPDFDPDSVSDLFAAAIEAIDTVARNLAHDLTDAIWQGITQLTDTGKTNSEIMAALRAIPFLNVLGFGGPATIGDSLQATWDQLVSGLVGAIGSGASLADLFNVNQDISSRASLGMFSWDILGIRNNKSINTGFLPTSESNIALDKIALQSSAPTFALTQSTAITAYQRISEAADKAAVSWLGSGVTNITDAFVNIYRMDTTTGLSTLVHASSNIAGLLSNTMQHNIYELPAALSVAAGEVYGIEVAVRGAGTHSIVGQSTWLPDHPTVFPRRMSSVRNSGTSAAPSTIAHSSLVYSANVPFVEFAVSSGDPGVPHSPRTDFFGSVGSFTIPVPLWANAIEVIAVGAGGGGRQGGTFSLTGEGGAAGSWSTATWARGTDFTGTPSIAVTVTAGGSGGSTGLGYGGDGGSTTVVLGAHTVTATGGAGGDALTAGTGNLYGRSPGNQVYGGVTYVGGAQQNASGSAGAPSGGGGSGGNDVAYQHGGSGARGGVWLRFKA